ncbi:MAG: hypothetical protein JW839_14180 [Candidatus Lokiarchaeota archaeon]|nr:hypothetical protein [Candidatus Lokiarchaeota archaeon]
MLIDEVITLTLQFKEFWFSINHLTALDENKIKEQLVTITRNFNSRLRAVQETDIKQKYITGPAERKVLVDILRNPVVESNFNWNMMDIKTSKDAFSPLSRTPGKTSGSVREKAYRYIQHH